jgi:hypothetical protein
MGVGYPIDPKAQETRILAWQVACPTCEARAGQVCHSNHTNGKQWQPTIKPHAARVKASLAHKGRLTSNVPIVPKS